MRKQYHNRAGGGSGVAVPSRSSIVAHLSRARRPLPFAELAGGLGIDTEPARQALAGRLDRMRRDGLVLQDRRERFALTEKMDLGIGRVSGHPDGYGFVIREDDQPDVYLAPRAMGKVFHGDRVLVRVTQIDRRGRMEGSVVEVIDSAAMMVGRCHTDHGGSYVTPEDRRIGQQILVPPDAVGEARDGQIVVVEITEHPIRRRHAAGRIVEVLGEHLAPGMETDVALRKYEIPHRWPEAVRTEARRVADPARIAAAIADREDLRGKPFVTIDGADARDFDDAVYAERYRYGWRLWVAIADVSHYVTPGSALDQEAHVRGTSVYFPSRVVPMLPEAISNGSCSLVPDEDRLTVVCEMRIGKDGEVRSSKFYQAAIHSHARLTYDAVWHWRQHGDAGGHGRGVTANLECLFEVFAGLAAARRRRGALELEMPEARFDFDSQQKISAVSAYHRNDAHRLIEECMLAANVCAATYVAKGKAGGLYRVHEPPKAERIDDLRRFLSGFSLQLGGGDEPGPADFQAIADASRNRPEITQLIQTVILRSMNQAVYSASSEAHFALGFEHYTHFTSPIRRYPDLAVHRAIKARLAGEKRRGKDAEHELAMLAEHCSMTERRADEASRDVVKWLKAEYMQDKIGNDYAGVISGVTAFGLFVQLDDIFVEGLIHVTELGSDYYHFDPLRYTLTGERSGGVFRLGDRIRVKVMAVNLDEGKIDFQWLDGAATRQAKTVGRRKQAGNGAKRSKRTARKRPRS